jgi:flagellar assembly protein FliH
MLEEQLSDHAGGEDEDIGSMMGELSDFHRDVLSESAMANPETALPKAPPPQGEDDDLPPG